MQFFTIVLAFAATAFAAGPLEPRCGAAGAACTSGDDCCVYCDPSSWTCAGSTTACVASGSTGLSSNDCCSGAYSSGSTCA